MLAVAEAAGDAAVELDEPVDRLRPAVAGAAGVEVGQERLTPLLERLAQALDLRDRTGRERGEDLLRDPPALDHARGLVGRAELLGAQPRDEDLVVAFVGRDRPVKPSPLPVGELLLATAQDRPDPVERVVLAATVAMDLLLDAASDLIDRLGAELDHVERVKHRGGVLELLVDGVLVAVERVQGRDLNTGLEVATAFFEPVAVRLPGPARHQVQQPRPRLAVLAGGQVDHPGQQLRPSATVRDRELADVVPHVLIDTEALHPGEPGLVVGHRLQQRPDRGPDRVPRRAQLSSDPADRGVFAADLVDRPPAGPCGQQGPWGRDVGVLLGEHLRWAQRLLAAPGPLAPHDADWPVEAWRVDERDVAAAVAACDHTAGWAAHRRSRRLDADNELADVVVEIDARHVQTIESNEKIAARAVAGVVMAARAGTRRRLGQRRGPSERCAWSPLILRASTLLTPTSRHHRRAAHPHRNSEEPV